MFVVGQRHQELLQVVWIAAGDGGEGVPEAPAGIPHKTLAPDDDGQGPQVGPGWQTGLAEGLCLDILLPTGFADFGVIVRNPVDIGIWLVETAKGIHIFVGDVANGAGGYKIQ